METNFFTEITKMNLTGDLQLIVKQSTDNNYIVSIVLQNQQCRDNAKQLIPPMILKGTAQELDSGFFENISTPLQNVSGLMVNMESFLKQMEETKRQSAMEKEKSDKEKKNREEKDKKYKEAMAKADEFDKEGKPREAWMKVPNPEDYPHYAEAIRKRKTELSDKFASPSLFGAEQSIV
jgi:PRTRC genetic system protein E